MAYLECSIQCHLCTSDLVLPAGLRRSHNWHCGKYQRIVYLECFIQCHLCTSVLVLPAGLYRLHNWHGGKCLLCYLVPWFITAFCLVWFDSHWLSCKVALFYTMPVSQLSLFCYRKLVDDKKKLHIWHCRTIGIVRVQNWHYLLLNYALYMTWTRKHVYMTWPTCAESTSASTMTWMGSAWSGTCSSFSCWKCQRWCQEEHFVLLGSHSPSWQ